MKVKNILLLLGMITIIVVIFLFGRQQINTINTRYYDLEKSIDTIMDQQQDSLDYYKVQIAVRDSIIQVQGKYINELNVKYANVSTHVNKVYSMLVESMEANSKCHSDTVK